MSERIGNRCTFPKIVGDDVFIIAEYDKEAYGSLRFITSPFHVSNTGMFVEGLGEMIVQDRGGAIQGQKIDVYFESHDAARQFGRQNVRFYIVNN